MQKKSEIPVYFSARQGRPARLGTGWLQAVLQQRELRGLAVRVRAVAALLRGFLSACADAR